MNKPFVRGFSLAEILVASFLGSILLVGMANFMAQTFHNSQAIRVDLVEQSFLAIINKVLTDEDSCKESLKPGNLDGDHKKKGIGVFLTGKGLSLEDKQGGENIIKIGTPFKNAIDIVKMELIGENNEATSTVSREFVVHYKKRGLDSFNTVAGGECTATDDVDCFKKRCKLNYKLDSLKTSVDTCEAIDCYELAKPVKAGIGPECPWGELFYNEKEREGNDKPKCQVRNTKEYLGSTCTGNSSLMLSQGDNTGRVVNGDKCKCQSKRIETVDGRCVSLLYSAHQCWPRNEDLATHDNKNTFCSKEYQGSEACIQMAGDSVYSKNSNEDEFKKLKQTLFPGLIDPNTYHYVNTSIDSNFIYKRVYNRETGEVKCIGASQYILRRADGDGNADHNSTVVTTIPTSWFYPQGL